MEHIFQSINLFSWKFHSFVDYDCRNYSHFQTNHVCNVRIHSTFVTMPYARVLSFFSSILFTFHKCYPYEKGLSSHSKPFNVHAKRNSTQTFRIRVLICFCRFDRERKNKISTHSILKIASSMQTTLSQWRSPPFCQWHRIRHKNKKIGNGFFSFFSFNIWWKLTVLTIVNKESDAGEKYGEKKNNKKTLELILKIVEEGISTVVQILWGDTIRFELHFIEVYVSVVFQTIILASEEMLGLFCIWK